jgi:hypothetical protein
MSHLGPEVARAPVVESCLHANVQTLLVENPAHKNAMKVHKKCNISNTLKVNDTTRERQHRVAASEAEGSMLCCTPNPRINEAQADVMFHAVLYYSLYNQ